MQAGRRQKRWRRPATVFGRTAMVGRARRQWLQRTKQSVDATDVTESPKFGSPKCRLSLQSCDDDRRLTRNIRIRAAQKPFAMLLGWRNKRGCTNVNKAVRTLRPAPNITFANELTLTRTRKKRIGTGLLNKNIVERRGDRTFPLAAMGNVTHHDVQPMQHPAWSRCLLWRTVVQKP